nr:alpha-hydroxy-acid oxidizing protein [Nonomuraea maritima]
MPCGSKAWLRFARALPWWVQSYVAAGCGDEHTQRANVAAFHMWGLVSRMLNGAYERDLSISLLGVDLPTAGARPRHRRDLLLEPRRTLRP